MHRLFFFEFLKKQAHRQSNGVMEGLFLCWCCSIWVIFTMSISYHMLVVLLTHALHSNVANNLMTWSTNAPLILKAGTTGLFRGIELDFNCSYTNRFQDSEVYLEEYNWRMIERPPTLDSVITYTTE